MIWIETLQMLSEWSNTCVSSLLKSKWVTKNNYSPKKTSSLKKENSATKIRIIEILGTLINLAAKIVLCLKSYIPWTLTAI